MSIRGGRRFSGGVKMLFSRMREEVFLGGGNALLSGGKWWRGIWPAGEGR